MIKLTLISLWYPIATLTITPALIGKLTKAFTGGNIKMMKIYLVVLIVLNVITIIINSIDQLESELFAADIAAFIKRKLIDIFFENHQTGTSSALDAEISYNLRIFSTATNIVIDLYRSYLVPLFIALFMESLYLVVFVDWILGIISFVIMAATFSAIWRSSQHTFTDANSAVIANQNIYAAIDEIVAMFDTIVSTIGGKEAEDDHIKRLSLIKRKFKERTIRAIIRFIIPHTLVIIVLTCVYGIHMYRRYVKPLTFMSTVEQKKLTGDSLDKAITSATMFFAILSNVRGLLLMTYTVSDACAKLKVSRRNFINSTKASIPTGIISALKIGSSSRTSQSLQIERPLGNSDDESKYIYFDNISFRYAPNRPKIFDSINFRIEMGKKTALIGPNGCGKSTIFKLLMRFSNPESGDIRIRGKSLLSMDPEESRRKIICAVQTPILFARSILENIIYPAKPSREKYQQVVSFIKSAGVFDYISKLPRGLDTFVGKRGEKLSGGQRQIVQILRTLFKSSKSDIILLDEVTSAVDANTRDIISRIIQSFPSNKTVIVITHDSEISKICNCQIDVSKVLKQNLI